ncbi:MAG: HEAT repeat domain-containing protein [Bacteroidota bacterium]|nr:HEAT repeat domain-containing protein [Bacteroidota bacterium]
MKANNKIESLILELRSKDAVQRTRARNALVKIGKPAVPVLIELLSDPKEHLRWEAAKALGRINDEASCPALVRALRDDSMEVRWLAAEALISLEEKAIAPLLEILEEEFDSPFILDGAHHILHVMERQKLLNEDTLAVLEKMRFLKPKTSVAIAARKALRRRQ